MFLFCVMREIYLTGFSRTANSSYLKMTRAVHFRPRYVSSRSIPPFSNWYIFRLLRCFVAKMIFVNVSLVRCVPGFTRDQGITTFTLFSVCWLANVAHPPPWSLALCCCTYINVSPIFASSTPKQVSTLYFLFWICRAAVNGGACGNSNLSDIGPGSCGADVSLFFVIASSRRYWSQVF